MLRVVLDTNVLVSAIISDGKPRALLRKGISKEFCIVTSDLILKELRAVLRRPKFKTDEDEIRRIILALMQAALPSLGVELRVRFRGLTEKKQKTAKNAAFTVTLSLRWCFQEILALTCIVPFI